MKYQRNPSKTNSQKRKADFKTRQYQKGDPSTHRQKKKTSDRKNKLEKIFAVSVVVICIVLYIGLEIHESEKYPKLSEFGLNEWSIKCKNENRSYHLLSDINWNEAYLSSRYLIFLNKNQKELYYTSRFEKKSLDKDGVWRFTYNPKDVRMFAEKDQSQVLKGDEKLFEIAEDFKSMTVITAEGENLTLPCQRIK